MKSIFFKSVIMLLAILAQGKYSATAQENNAETLIIEGKNIWIRDLPSTGKVIMKLNTGDQCKILEKGKYEKIRGMKDYWYKINFNGRDGWVYGSQTSVKQVIAGYSSIKIQELQAAIKEKVKKEDEEEVQDCECMVESSIELAFQNENYAFINVKKEKCGATCTHSNYSFLIVNSGNNWSIKAKLEGGFKAIFESGVDSKKLLLLEKATQYHLMEKKSSGILFLFDEKSLTMTELGLNTTSCEILNPKEFGCNYCTKNTSKVEKLNFVDNPVTSVKKVITITQFNKDCSSIESNSKTEKYKWNKELLKMEKE